MVFCVSLYQTLRICIQVQFSQRYGQIKDRRPNFFLYIFGLAWPWDPRGPGTYFKFVQNPLMIDLWMEECQFLMIFYLVVIHGIKIIKHLSWIVPFKVKLCRKHFVTIITLEGFTYFLEYLVFCFFLFFFLINIGIIGW